MPLLFLYLLAHTFLHGDRDCDRCADHGVVAHADEAHHLDVRGNGRGARELRIRVHSAHRICHAVGRRTRRHVVGVQRSARAAARCDGEVLKADLVAPLLIGARDGMLEARGVGGIARDGDAHLLQLHDRNAFGDVVRAIALDLCAGTVRIGDLVGDGNRLRIGIKHRFAIGEAVDAGDDERRVLAKAVEDDAQRVLTDLIRVHGNGNRALCRREGLVSREEAEAVRLLGKEHLAQIAVAETDLSVLGDRAGDAERLQADADGSSRIRRVGAARLDSDRRADGVCPDRVLKADGLGAAHDLVAVYALCKADVPALFDRGDAVLFEDAVDLIDSSLISFKQSHTAHLLTLCEGRCTSPHPALRRICRSDPSPLSMPRWAPDPS